MAATIPSWYLFKLQGKVCYRSPKSVVSNLFFSLIQVSIDPPDAVESTLEVEKVGEPPGPAQAPFYGLLPGFFLVSHG